MKRFILILIVLAMLLPLGASGMPVFDVQSWIYSVMSYTQDGQSLTNTISEIKRQIELAERLYKAISEGDLQSALSSMSGLSSRIESSLARIGVQSEIYSSLVDISASSTQWSSHLDDPDYFASVLQELTTLQQQVESERMDYLAERQSTAEEDLASARNKTDMTSVAIESSTEADNKMVNELSEANSREASSQIDESSKELMDLNADTVEELTQKATYNKIKADLRQADTEYIESMERNIPKVNVDFEEALSF